LLAVFIVVLSFSVDSLPIHPTVLMTSQAPSFMGGIHPRFKHEVGRRLALAYNGVLNPTIAGCTVAPTAGVTGAGGDVAVAKGADATLELRFDPASVKGDSIAVQCTHLPTCTP